MRTAIHATRVDARRLGGIAALAALVASAACTHGEITVVEPAAKGPSDTLALTILPGGTEAAAELGWKAGIPGAQVIIAPSVKPRAMGAGDTATGPPFDTLMTDSSGRVSVPDLPEGWYYVEVRRLLTPAELARLAPGEDVIGFMTQKTVERGGDTVSVPGSHRGSIVISEVSNFAEWVPAAGTDYYYGDYLELANNGDTTVYLDGLVIGVWEGDAEWEPGWCAAHATWDDDPNGVWVQYMDSLPGTGHDYPLAPGAVAVIATDAIDHRTNSPAYGLDLSHANFEFVGTEDADNPSVPNSVVIGPNGEYGGGFYNHGMQLRLGLDAFIVVALPVYTASLPKAQKYSNDNGWVQRIPRDHILDVMLAFWPHLDNVCPTQVNSAFDRQPAPLFLTELPDGTWKPLGAYSVQRKVAYTGSGGRKILQNTRSTEADFFVGLRTPFQLP